jgi:hypothetical protein
MHVREHHAPVAHLLLVSGLIALAFLACEGLHLLDHKVAVLVGHTARLTREGERRERTGQPHE